MARVRSRRIESKEVALTSTGSWAGTIVFFVFSAGFFLFALVKIRDLIAILVTGFFAAWGVFGIARLITARSSQQRYGPLPLELEEPAPTVGGRLRASLQLPAAATAAPLSLSAVLTCSKVTYREDRQKLSRIEEPLRGLRKVIAVAHGSSSGARATFDFDLPADLPHADDPGPGDAVPNAVYGTWELKVEAVGSDLNLSRSYAIPVGRAVAGAATTPPGASPAPAPLAPGEGPMEIVRPGAPSAAPSVAAGGAVPHLVTRALVPPAAPTAAVPPAAVPPAAVPLAAVPAASARVSAPSVPSARTQEPEAPGFVPEDDNTSLWVLVAINLIPLAGVMFAGWRVHEVVMLYWIENIVIGAVNVLRMRIAVPGNMADLARRGVAPSDGELLLGKMVVIGFFILHYGAFCYGHGTFLASFFPPQAGGSRELGAVLRAMLLEPASLVAITGIVLSHAYSYFHNYIGRGEYLRADVGQMMVRPYKRIVVTHLFIFAGAFAMLGLGSPAAAMAAFIGIKIGMDAYAHRQERKQLAAPG